MGKRKLAAVVVASAVLLTGSILLAERLSDNYQLEFEVGNKEYTVNGTIKQFDVKTENLPLLDRDTGVLMLPLRCVIEEMGGTLEWNQENQNVVLKYKGTTMELKADSQHATIDGYGIVLEEAPKNWNGALYVSADFIANNLGTEIEWMPEKNQIVIRTEEIRRPVVNRNVLDFDGKNGSYFVEVPVITGLNDKNYERQLNQSFARAYIEKIRSFVLKNEKYTKKEGELIPYYWTSKFLVTMRNSSFISILQKDERKDAPDGVSVKLEGINIDLQTQAQPLLGELFKNKKYKTAVLKEMDKLIENHIVSYPKPKVEQWTEKEEENYYFQDGKLVIFQELSKTETAEFPIPVENLKRYWRDGYIAVFENKKTEVK